MEQQHAGASLPDNDYTNNDNSGEKALEPAVIVVREERERSGEEQPSSEQLAAFQQEDEPLLSLLPAFPEIEPIICGQGMMDEDSMDIEIEGQGMMDDVDPFPRPHESQVIPTRLSPRPSNGDDEDNAPDEPKSQRRCIPAQPKFSPSPWSTTL